MFHLYFTSISETLLQSVNAFILYFPPSFAIHLISLPISTCCLQTSGFTRITNTTKRRAPSLHLSSTQNTKGARHKLFASCFADRKKGMSLARQIKKRFSRSKKRSHSAERSSNSLREGSNYLQPPDSGHGKPQSKGSSASLFCSSAIVVCDVVDIHQSPLFIHVVGC